jgi:hypothetical protein
MALDLQSDSSIQSTWEQIRQDESGVNWLLVGYDENDAKKVKLVGSGSGGMEELKGSLDDNAVLYGVFKVIGVDQDSRRTKLVFVTWIGSGLSPLKRARTSTHKSAFTQFFNGFHVEIYASSTEDLNQEDIISRLNASTGAHKPKSYEF